MDGEGLGLAGRCSAMAPRPESLVGFEEALPEASDEQLGAVMAEAESLAARAQAARAMVAVEAVKRGVVAGSGMNAHAWVQEHAPSLRQGAPGRSRGWSRRWRTWPGRREAGAGCSGAAGPGLGVGDGVGRGEGRRRGHRVWRCRRWVRWCGWSRAGPARRAVGGGGAAGAGHGVGCGTDAEAAPGDAREVRGAGGVDDVQERLAVRHGCRSRGWSPVTCRSTSWW